MLIGQFPVLAYLFLQLDDTVRFDLISKLLCGLLPTSWNR
ncbi:hypothetical protein ID866_10220 [Astraeus odoratus]|nr:hypothetical protein ID866_10220 [Astraeus odoratus]